MRDGGLIINGHQFFREKGVVPYPVEEEQNNRMADGSLTTEYAYEKRGIQCDFDYMTQSDLEFLQNAIKRDMEVSYYPIGGTQFERGTFRCTEKPSPKIRGWDYSQSPPLPYWTDISLKLEEI